MFFCGIDDKFQMQLGCSMLPYVETKLNVLQKSATLPSIFPLECRNGQYKYEDSYISPK